MDYKFTTGLKKTIIQAVLFGFPLIMQSLPEQWMNLTLGAVLSLAFNYAKVKYLRI